MIIKHFKQSQKKSITQMAKQFKNTQAFHLLSESNSKRTKCGLNVTEFSDIVNKEGFMIPATTKAYQFKPFKIDYFESLYCKKCHQSN